jgi:hypothetical protein
LAYHRLLYHVAASGVGNAVPSPRNRHLLATLSVVSSYVYQAIAHQACFNAIAAKVVAATNSRPLARIVQLCLTRDLGQRAAAMATMFADVSPEMTSRQQMNARVGALKANNKRLKRVIPATDGQLG